MSYGSTLHIPPTNLRLLATKQELYQKKSLSLYKKILKNFLEKVQKKGPAGRKGSGRKGNRTRQKNKRGDSKAKSNDSPEIPDRGETSNIPGLPSGGQTERKMEDTERQVESFTGKHTDRQGDAETDREKQRDRRGVGKRKRETDRQRERETETDRQTDRDR